MSPMTVPDGGLHLESSEPSDSLPMQAFGVTLNDSLIEDLINCVQKGSQIELFLGSTPTLHYGEYEEPLKPSAELLDSDLYLTNLSESKTTAHRIALPTMSILKRPPPGSSKPHIRVEKAPVAKGGKGSRTKALQGKSAMSMALSGSSTTRSLPTSPALTGVASPMHENPAFAAQQQQLEKNKEQRSVVVHELAVGDQSYDYLETKWTGAEADLKSTLGKVADKIGDKYSMKKIYWKELDVWNYKYEPSENRQKAIENAKRQYDKQRLETTHEAWERLLEEKDRGKGIILSKLQAQIAKGNMTPAFKSSKAEETNNKTSSDEGAKSKAGGEAMARSNSQPVGSKSKKVSERETLTKSLLSNKPTTKKPTTTTKKAAPASKPSKAAEKGGKKFLSEEFVEDSSSEDEAPLANTTTASKPKPMEKPVEKKPERVVERPKEKPQPPPAKIKERSPPPVTKAKERSPAPAPAPKPKPAKSVIRAPRPTTTSKASTANTGSKRPRDEDDSSSSSGAPLMKRMKPKEAPAKPLSSTTLKHRPSDASQNSRATPVNASYKSKNTSPVKSSPLASSPPTNASDIDDNSQSSQSQHHDRDRHQASAPASRVNGRSTTNGNTPNGVSAAKKRPAVSQPVSSQPAPALKKRVTKDVLDKAHKFDKFYERYQTLHNQLVLLANPPKDQVSDLLDMRDRLVTLKAEIRREVDLAA
ncbi:hypothetical protein G7054_g776 [Neopestalotiopsis clavispora]|nr:hypothetical protein G7054_g776 [Neopestalotiopsis clavispora]